MAKELKSLRENLLNIKVPVRKKVVDINGHKIEIRQPLNYQAQKINERAKGDEFMKMLAMVLELCYTPGTDDHIFEDTDIEAFKNLPANSWLDTLVFELVELLSKPEAAKKN